ncbi:hypothetical protein HYPSUDRAFT_142437 [Hypholoma sublateritium FD-334 SS-4]|uniref:Prokaryotic-type class I peptide chain release factors domain-containing protein n=1 Tax=Hypholoma sublateritium (strain FD-334 SS-4) TaxID=945553 RepID=A0A0D2PJX1_HYPSF|nr:hypothetical protein HYPSUDRAFT_142437 [Hypholoma sublateritium FD-334 SS-4]
MSISPALRAANRAAYRDVLRAASVTFSGKPFDLIFATAFRAKIRSDMSKRKVETDESLQKQTQFVQDVANVLRKNVVQGILVKSPEESGGDGIYRIRLTKDTELGDNESIKNPTPVESGRSARRKERGEPQNSCHSDAAQPEAPVASSTSSPPPRYFNSLRKAHKERVIPDLREEDLEETFVRGSGPGGQSINKTENNVQLVHKPTGLRVACQDTRSLSQNRKLARRWLLEKACLLDKMVNPGLSKEELKAAKQRERERQRRKKAKKKARQEESENDS